MEQHNTLKQYLVNEISPTDNLTNIELLCLTIVEGSKKVDWIVSQWGEKVEQAARQDDSANQLTTAEDIVNKLQQAEPAGSTGAFLVFVVRMYIQGQFRIEDISRLKSDLETFVRVKSKLTNRDINAYETLPDLYDALKPFETQKVLTKGEQERISKAEGAKKIIDTPNFKVLELLTHSAACLYGSGTKWCTASAEAEATFKDYSNQGQIYVILAGTRKFQFHYESGQFMNEKDQELTKKDIAFLSSFPEYQEFLHFLIDKHYYEQR